MNIDIMDHVQNTDAGDYLNVLGEAGFEPFIDKPTRVYTRYSYLY